MEHLSKQDGDALSYNQKQNFCHYITTCVDVDTFNIWVLILNEIV